MKVCTYFSEVAELHDPDLLTLWRDSWTRHGWEPVVHTEADIRYDPHGAERLRQSPLIRASKNPKAYTLACLLRWIPMTFIATPALAVDCDVLCNGYRPSQIPACSYPPVFLAGDDCPCAIYSDADGFRLFLAAIECLPLTPWFSAEEAVVKGSDQYISTLMPRDWKIIDPKSPCLRFKEQPGWEKAPMIHFMNRLTSHPRSAAIRATGLFS